MGFLANIWKKLTPTNALARFSGDFEMLFFESIYRINYAAESSISYLVYSSTVKMLIATILFGEVWFVYSESQNLEMDDVAACVNVIVIQMITICKIKNMMDHSGVYRRLANSMYFDISTRERRRLVQYWASRHERCLKLLLGLGNCALAAWHLYPLLDDIEYNLMVAIRLPFRFNTPHRYPVTYFVVGIAFTYVSHFVMVTDLLMQAYLVPLACQMNVLADCFVNIIEDCKKGSAIHRFYDENNDNVIELEKDTEFTQKYQKRLGELIKQHKLILNNTMDLRAILSGPLLGQLVASGTLICFVAYQATAAIVGNILKCLMSVFYLGYNLFSFYIICLWCQEITTQSDKIGEAVYCSGWERGLATLPGVRASIALVIARASKPLVFTAGGMYGLSLNAYTKLVKTSYSALTVLLRFRHE